MTEVVFKLTNLSIKLTIFRPFFKYSILALSGLAYVFPRGGGIIELPPPTENRCMISAKEDTSARE